MQNEESFSMGGATFTVRRGGMASAKELDDISAYSGFEKLPESFFAQNRLTISTPKFELSFSARESARYFNSEKTRGEIYRASAAEKGGTSESVPFEASKWDEQAFAFSENLQVPVSDKWEHKPKEVSEVQPADLSIDWTHLNLYGGTFVPGPEPFTVESNSSIPESRLTVENTVLWFRDLYMFESDLDDWGYSCVRVRIRVQKDSAFVLLRSYIRVDNAHIRMIDHRFFIDFSDFSLVRRVDFLANSYTKIQNQGFVFHPGFNMDHSQSDIVAKFLENKHSACQRFVANS